MYRENIYEVMESTGEKISKMVIPKNKGLKGYAWQVLKESGLEIDKATEKGKNMLEINGISLILKRGEDIPQLVTDYASRGEVVLGLTGDDLFDEYRLRTEDNSLRVETTYDWFDEKAKYFRPTLCFINKTGSSGDIPLEARIAISPKYLYTSREYLKKSPMLREKKFKEIIYNGDVEISVAEGANNCCIDTVYTGDTLEEYGLNIIQKIRFSDLVVISPLKKEESLIGRALRKEYAQILDRLVNPTDSYTSKMLKDDELIAKKLTEETLELILASFGKGDMSIEAPDVMYAFTALLVKANYTLDDLAGDMIKKQK